MGWNAQPTRLVSFDNARVPFANRLGDEGIGFKIAMAGLDGGRLNNLCVFHRWRASRARQGADYMKERKAFGKRLDEFQALQFRIADMATELERRAHLPVARGGRSRPQGYGCRRVCARWRSGSAPMWRSMSPIRRCNCTAAMAICRLRHRENRARSARAPDSRRHQRNHAADRGAQPDRFNAIIKETAMTSIAFIGLGNMGRADGRQSRQGRPRRYGL